MDAFIREFSPAKDWGRFAALNFQTFFDSIPADDAVSREQFKKLHPELLKRYVPSEPSRGMITVAAGSADDYFGHCWLGVQTEFFTNRPVPWIFDLTVREEYRGKGIGRLLLKDCMFRVRKMGHVHIGLQVMHHNHRALAFYEREGFTFRSHGMLLGSIGR